MSTSKAPKRYLVTSALPYANGPLHIGHIAGAYLPADVFVRFLLMKGEDVVFVCGSDEHGAAITLRAKKENIPPQAVIDKYHQLNKKAFEDFGIGFDIYHRTSSELHHQTAQGFFEKLYANGSFTTEETEQYYDAEQEQFLADRYIKGTCPKCGHTDAYGDQCEKCGTSLSPLELINPRSVLSGSKPVLRKTSHWFLPLNEHEAWVREWIEQGQLDGKSHHDPKAWKNHVLGQCKSWLDGGLKPRAMTRDLDWGVRVPLENAPGKVLYVWLDAPIGYVSATKAWAEAAGKDWKPYWQDEQTALIHFIGKDNIVFHCIIFPIILKAHGDYILPTNVPANEFLNLEGQKISTSRNWAVWLHEYMEDFPDKADVLRYVLNSIAPENKDSEFTWKDFQARNNNELVAVLGNFVNRAMVMTHKHFKGEVPLAGELLPVDLRLLEAMAMIPSKVELLISQYKIREAQFEAMNLARLGNKYLADMQPWKLVKDDPEIVKTVMNLSLQVCANLAIILKPFLPETAEKIRFMLGSPELSWDKAGRPDLMLAYEKLRPSQLLFSKIDDEIVAEQVEKLARAKLMNTPSEAIKPETDFDTFSKTDLRIGTIIHAEKIPKTKKLLKLTIADGQATRTIVSGIAEYYQPEQIVNKQVVFLANLAPKQLKGIMSEGMILMAEDRDGSLSFVQPDKKLLDGSVVR